MAGYNSGEIVRQTVDAEKGIYTDCEVNGVTVSCYNGYPEIMSQYYPSEHNAYVGGICGRNDKGKISNVKLNVGGITYNGGSTESRSLAPEMGLICGRSSKGAQVSGTVTETTVNKGNLREVTWKGGFLNLQTYTWNQAQYVKNEIVGHVA